MCMPEGHYNKNFSVQSGKLRQSLLTRHFIN
ncbi:hypothetical protein BN439_0150 [Erwinia amylovora Ea644]|uniref:Uncharacterized protein n=1 Tax=Erwinia amylovora (strain CFBP1430) TaxID=665029 RepID=D4HUG9_ERWAC|nr:hypothetical protein EHX00_0150 [Erwinia amylovora]CBA19092.1 hypothetical protein predicted by Glimmer/Critica [Erwinia amylovora CFBP1430]CCP01257.1 hypothetical protein BN439_0150 [Erwinia amylovora Ea644]QJQ56555.1 hypothetical protein EHW99_0150 [Erwinia amylovora]QJQ60254.1 hypothetical protein EHW98_0150 [Erwinia amylovora]